MDLSKYAFFATIGAVAALILFAAGVYTAAYRTPVFVAISEAKKSIEEGFGVTEELVRTTPIHHLQPTRYPGDGVTRNTLPDDGALIMLSGLFEDQNEVRLIRRNGEVVARWPLSFGELFPDPAHLTKPPLTDWHIDLHGALVEPDGSVVANFEYGGTVKQDRCGKTLWTIQHPTHHSVEKASDGGYWIPGRRDVEPGDTRHPPFQPPYVEDLILKVSADGRIVDMHSTVDMLYENGFMAMLTASGDWYSSAYFESKAWDKEVLHINKITELSADLAELYPQFEAGDLMLSFRTYNLIMVVDPETWQVKWHQIGPWMRQHDPEFGRDGMIKVFNNNSFMIDLADNTLAPGDRPSKSNIISFDPAARKATVIYGNKPGEKLQTVIRGKHQLLDDGGFLITEFESGRVIQITADGDIVWEYVNRYDDQNVAEISEALVYRPDHFQVSTWHCN